MSALPHCVENDRLPCLATRAPAPATTNAATVEILNVEPAPPPVPQVSSSGSGSTQASIRRVFSRMARAKPSSSSGCLAFHPQAHQERGYLRRGGRAVQDDEHRFVSFGGRQILAGGDLVEERQKHEGLWIHVTMNTRNG